MALRPQWILGLLLALGFAAGFVLLSEWQISRSVAEATVIERETEKVVDLDAIASPQSGVTSVAARQKTSTVAKFRAEDFSVLSGRPNEGREGYWLVGHAVTSSGASLAIALGWAPSAAAALEGAPASEGMVEIEGRYQATEPSGDDDFESGERSAMAVATLINEWQSAPETVYGGYLILSEAPPGLETIDAPAPSEEVLLNWLNIFYAVEWIVFAGFAIFLWARFLRDAWEREQEEAELN